MKNLKLTLAILFASFVAIKNTNAQSTISTNTNSAFEVKYLGDKNGYLYFEIEVSDVVSKNKILKITDAEEGDLYVKYIDFNPKSQLYKIEKTESQTILFNLTINNKEYNKSYTFKTELLETSTLTQNTLVKN